MTRPPRADAAATAALTRRIHQAAVRDGVSFDAALWDRFPPAIAGAILSGGVDVAEIGFDDGAVVVQDPEGALHRCDARGPVRI